MHLSYRKKLLGCFLVLVVCLWVIYQTTILAVKYDKLVNSLNWELDRCIHKQGLDSKGKLGPGDLYSHFTLQGYPGDLTTVGPTVLEHSPRLFTARSPKEQRGKLSYRLSTYLWPLSVTSDPWPVCTRYYDEAFVFTLRNSPSEGLYYNLHVSTFLPLYALVSLRSHLGPRSPSGYSVVLMPAVENYEVQSIDWSTKVFGEQNKFSMLQQMLDTFAGSMRVMPLTKDTMHTGETTCFMTAHFGVGSVNVSDPALLRGFSLMILARLGLSLPQATPPEPFVCLAKRTLNLRILNAEELVSSVHGFVRIQVIQFEGLSYREQVSHMQRCTILVGFHGDELLNAIYMPRDSVTVQLLPFEPKGLNPSKYSDLVRAHGPYLEWTNTIEDNSRPNEGFHGDSSLVDTVVDVNAFVKLITDALKLGINKKLVFMQT